MTGTPDLAAAIRAAQERTRTAPGDMVAWHELAALLHLVGRDAEAVRASGESLRLGADAVSSATWLLHGRAQAHAGDYEAAEAAFRAALRLDPSHPEAHEDLARLVWMRRGDLDAALAELDAAVAAYPEESELVRLRIELLERGGRRSYAFAAAGEAAAAFPRDASILRLVAQLALEEGDLDRAGSATEAALASAPEDRATLELAARVALVRGDPAHARTIVERLLQGSPDDQVLWALKATALRTAADPVYRALYDYDAFVRTFRIETPPGWSTLEGFLDDVAAALAARHRMSAHPLDQTLRGGVQTVGDLSRSDDPAIQALFSAFEAPIRRYIAELGAGSDPLRRRKTGDYAFSGGWSVRLKPNGFHVDHVHSAGWLSSAFYVRTPAGALEAEGRQGWIRFGKPGPRTPLPLEAEHYVRPQPGMLVLFPSYMWHGTVPFSSDEERLTVAFDVVPA